MARMRRQFHNVQAAHQAGRQMLSRIRGARLAGGDPIQRIAARQEGPKGGAPPSHPARQRVGGFGGDEQRAIHVAQALLPAATSLLPSQAYLRDLPPFETTSFFYVRNPSPPPAHLSGGQMALRNLASERQPAAGSVSAARTPSRRGVCLDGSVVVPGASRGGRRAV